ncbi:hypothetical protein M8C13_08990 [Crossiella sp. SN42]|uniref:hypothetical protein n=1 Tax=Crossiella sp. SN42 TaxID=2944808 RepID=UPI00207CB05A|nr:hypothetical protein [Crossiella sp. SN42]MCO1575892.1 hypothetical protein [Crossiella sp. SN42]
MYGLRNTFDTYYTSPAVPHLDTTGAPVYGDSAAFFLGRGPAARWLGELPDRATPGQLVHRPGGRAVLTSPTGHDYHRALGQLLATRASTEDHRTDRTRYPLCPPPGRAALGWKQYPPRSTRATHLYAYDHGAIHLWVRDIAEFHTPGQWHTLLLPEHTGDPVWLIPEARTYGTQAIETAELELAEIAPLLFADATSRHGETKHLPAPQDLWLHVTDDHHLAMRVFGLPDHLLGTLCAADHLGDEEPSSKLTSANFDGDPTLHRIATAIWALAEPYDWTNPVDSHDVRFRFAVRFLSHAGQQRFAHRRGTITLGPDHRPPAPAG